MRLRERHGAIARRRSGSARSTTRSWFVACHGSSRHEGHRGRAHSCSRGIRRRRSPPPRHFHLSPPCTGHTSAMSRSSSPPHSLSVGFLTNAKLGLWHRYSHSGRRDQRPSRARCLLSAGCRGVETRSYKSTAGTASRRELSGVPRSGDPPGTRGVRLWRAPPRRCPESLAALSVMGSRPGDGSPVIGFNDPHRNGRLSTGSSASSSDD